MLTYVIFSSSLPINFRNTRLYGPLSLILLSILHDVLYNYMTAIENVRFSAFIFYNGNTGHVDLKTESYNSP